MREAINAMSCQQYLFLTDLPGGTPCNRAMAIMMQNPSVEVLAGVNLPMIINTALNGKGVQRRNWCKRYAKLVKTAFKIFEQLAQMN